jgi:hypothetical protein
MKRSVVMEMNARKASRSSVSSVATRRRKPADLEARRVLSKEEQILRAATKHLVFTDGMFLVATDLREASIRGLKIWIITVTLRYTTGHEGYIGDLLYDGKDFTFLTPPEVRKQRARQIAADPKRMHKWNEYRASTLSTGKG